MELRQLPEHLLVLGGNYLGLEFGQMFRRFGSRVSVIEINDQIVPREDPEVGQALREALEGEGIEFHTGSQARSVTKSADGGLDLTVEARDGASLTLHGSHLLAAIGQQPNSDDLGLDRAGIEVDRGGYIVHNDRLETTAPGVWVIGDVKGGPAFTHVSYDDHLVIWDNLIEGKDRGIRGRILPYALYTDPELGRVGLSETEARAQGYRLKVGSIPMAWVARAIERSETRGLMKVVIDADSDRILGAAILGSEGGELVQNLMGLMLAGAPWTLYEKRMFIHPTLTEGFFTLMDSVKEVD
jgi:pyruvate/2-oxoglutarate dehydrogenase complex dihydrolipoamide dehydrogenase (E3) component